MQTSGSAAKTAVAGLHKGASLELGDERLAALAANAGPLKRILESPPLHATRELYKTYSDKATELQAGYRRQINLISYSLAIALLLACLALLADLGGEFDRIVKTIAYFVTAFVFIMAPAVFYLINRQKLHTSWYAMRMQAEQYRSRIFSQAISAHETSNAGELPVAELKLAFLEECHFDLQRDYYNSTVQKNRKRTKFGHGLGWSGFVILGLAALAAMLLLASVASEHMLLPAALQDLTSRIQLWIDILRIDMLLLIPGMFLMFECIRRFVLSLMDESERNANTYEKAVREIDALKASDLSIARNAMPTAQAEAAIQQFRQKLQAILDREHNAWKLAVEGGQPVASNPMPAASVTPAKT